VDAIVGCMAAIEVVAIVVVGVEVVGFEVVDIVVVGFEVVDIVLDEAIPGVVADLTVVVEAVDVVVVVVVVAAEGVTDVVVVSALSVGRHHFSPPVLTLGTVGAVSSLPVLTLGTVGAVSSEALGEAGERVDEGALKPLGAGDGLDGLRPRRRFANSAKLRSEYLLSPTA
jgi:hypothetical protein